MFVDFMEDDCDITGGDIHRTMSKTETDSSGGITHSIQFINCTEEEWNQAEDQWLLEHYKKELIHERKINYMLAAMLAVSVVIISIGAIIILGG